MKRFDNCHLRALVVSCVSCVSCVAGVAGVACLALAGGPASAATLDVCLRVDQFQIPGPVPPATVGHFGNPTPITMWAFIQTGTGGNCTFTTPAPAPTASVLAYPKLSATEGDTLIVHLMNNLPATVPAAYVPPPAFVTPGKYTEPVSLVIPGQPFTAAPTWTDGGAGNRTSPSQRVRSFTTETPPAATTLYKFGPLKAGTYLVESGTHPAVQVQMGLYGLLRVVPAIAGRAYPDPSSAVDSEVSLLFSEIDPVLHDAIATGRYGSAPAAPNPKTDPAAQLPDGWMTSAVDYHPRYFLLNGRPYTPNTPPVVIGSTNKRVLLRFLNAGLATKVPLLQGPYLSIIAEDGYFLSATGFTGAPPNLIPGSCPAPRQQYSVLLPAGKTIDAILTTPPSAVSIPLYDRRLNLNNNGAFPGGLLSVLATTAVGGAVNPPPLPAPCTLVGVPFPH